MAFDGIITFAITKELAKRLTGGKIEKVYQPETDELIFHIHAHGENYKLYASCASSHARVHLLTESPVNPQTPLAFCMLLRKHLAGGRITEITQIDTERILEIHVDTINELGFSVNKKLIIEIMGKHSNIILIDAATQKIIDSIKRVSIDESRVRQILPGKIYELPPTQGKIPLARLTPQSIEQLSNCSASIISKSLLSGIQGISPGIADRLASIAESSEARLEDYGDVIYRELLSMRAKLDSDDYTPVCYLDDTKTPLDFHIFSLPAFESLCEKQVFHTANECVEFYYIHKAGANRVKQKTADLEKAIKGRLDKLYLKKQRLSEDLLKAENSDTLRLFGELLTANLYLVNPGDIEARVISYYDGTEVIIPLDKRLTPAKNAQNYFKKYGKAKTAIKEKTVQLADTNADITWLETVESFVENAATAEEIEALRDELTEQGYLKKRKSKNNPSKIKPAPFKYKTSDGFRVLAGKNNQENEFLTFKTAERTDLWLHTKDIPGSHVILFTEGRQPSESAIFEAAGIAAYHSKGKTSENVPVDYVPVKYVKKPSGAKPGMVIFTNNRTVYVNPKLPEVSE